MNCPVALPANSLAALRLAPTTAATLTTVTRSPGSAAHLQATWHLGNSEDVTTAVMTTARATTALLLPGPPNPAAPIMATERLKADMLHPLARHPGSNQLHLAVKLPTVMEATVRTVMPLLRAWHLVWLPRHPQACHPCMAVQPVLHLLRHLETSLPLHLRVISLRLRPLRRERNFYPCECDFDDLILEKGRRR